MNSEDKIVEWAIKLQSIAQIGLTYQKNVFDKERYEELRNIASEMMSIKSGISLDKVEKLFCNEIGYQTPKLDTRAAIFENGKILLVKEYDGKWALPGGWVDVDISVGDNMIKEVKEEAGLDVTIDKVVAIHDREKHNKPIYAYKICKVFAICTKISGEFKENHETVESKYFNINEIENLAEEKNTLEQIKMCFDAYNNDNWKTIID